MRPANDGVAETTRDAKTRQLASRPFLMPISGDFPMQFKTTLCALALVGAAVAGVATTTQTARAISVDQVASVGAAEVAAVANGHSFGSHGSFHSYGSHNSYRSYGSYNSYRGYRSYSSYSHYNSYRGYRSYNGYNSYRTWHSYYGYNSYNSYSGYNSYRSFWRTPYYGSSNQNMEMRYGGQ